ncbi:MAG: MerC domain-containing protein, partial [Pseudomonadota bacterium]
KEVIMREKLTNVADKSAIFLSALCIVHCLILPILIIAMPAISAIGFLTDEHFHELLIFFIIPISAMALVSSFIKLKDLRVFYFVVVGILLVTLAAFIGHDVFGHVGEVIATVIGSLLIAYGHTKNLLMRKQSLA